MVTYYGEKSMERVFNSQRQLVRKFGAEQAGAIARRLGQLRAANTLSILGHLPPLRCHQLKGNRSGQFSVDLRHPYRLIFEPADDPVPVGDDGSIDRSKVTAVRIVEVVDYHG